MIEHPDKTIRAKEQVQNNEMVARAAAIVAHEANIDELLRDYLSKPTRTAVEYRFPYFGQDDIMNELAKRYETAGWKVRHGAVFPINPPGQPQKQDSLAYLSFS